MNQDLKEKIHYYVPHALRVLRPDNRTILQVTGWDSDEILYTKEPDGLVTICNFRGCRPLLRPLSSLTKEIVVSNYNDGKPFVPIIELNRMRGVTTSQYDELFKDGDCYGCKWGGIYSFYFEEQTLSFFDNGNNGISPQFDMFQALFQWHFWIGDQSLFDTGEIIRIEG